MAFIATVLASFPVLGGILGSLLGQPMLITWGSRVTSLVPNTAVCLLLLCASLAALSSGRRRLAQILGLVAAIFAATILSQYLTDRDYGIDRLIMTVPIGSPRTSPNAGTAIILLGLAMFFAGFTGPSRRVAIACASGAGALALLAFLGYATGLMPAFRWGTLAGMSMPTATTVLLLTFGFFASTHIKSAPLDLGMPLLATGIIMLVAISTSAVITNANLIGNNRWVRHSLETRETLRGLGQKMDLMDRIERSHFNTGNLGDAARMARAETEVWQQLANLRALVVENPAQVSSIPILTQLLTKKTQQVRHLFTMGIQGQVQIPDRKREVLISLDRSDAATSQIDQMLDLEAKSLAERSAAAEKSAEQTRGITWVAGGISLALLLAAVIAQRQARRSQEDARKAMEAAHDSAIQASRLKSEFLANMSHELRTPMNGIIGMSELLLEAPLAREHRDMSEMVLHSAEALLKIINDILDFSKIEAGRMHIDSQPLELRRVIEDCTVLLAPRAHEKGVELVLDYDERMPVRFLGDGGRIRQIVMNLVGNAVKFTSHGEVLIRVALNGTSNNRTGIRVEVHDTGDGIPIETQGRLFEPFTQADAATTRRFGGTGLGLAISRQLVELMGGKIGFQSSERVGTMFWFEIALPLDLVQPESTPIHDLAGRHFLVVDDTANNRKVLSAQLASMEATAEGVKSAAEALEALDHRGPFTAVLLDWHLPGRDGLSLAKELRATAKVGGGRPGSEWLVLLSSAASIAQAEQEGIFDAVLAKPVRMADLQRCLLRLVQGSKAPPSREPEGSVTGPPRANPDGSMHLLLVEDNISNQRVARLLLERLGHTVEVAADGEVGLRMLAEHRYDAVLMDCQMPVLDGFEATRRIRSGEAPGVNPDIYIIALTANAMASDRFKCLDAGMNDFVTKPVRMDDLRAVLAKCLN